MTDNFEHALEKENRRLNTAVDAERALTEKAEALVRHQQGIINNLSAEVAQLNDLVRRGNDDEAALRAEVERLEKRAAWLNAEVEEARAALKASQEHNDSLLTEVERLTRERDEARIEHERLRSIIKAGRAAHNEDRVRADTLGRERDEERRMRLIHEEAAAGARNDHAEVVERLRVAETERNEAREDRDALESRLGERLEEANHLRGVALKYEQERDEWKARAEQTERERDEWKATAERQNDLRIEAENEAAKARTRAEAAEADNAALLSVLRRFRERPPPETRPDSAQAFMRWHMDNERAADEAIAADHPGAALLERLESAERWMRVVREELVNAGGKSGDRDVALASLRSMLARLREAEKVVEAGREWQDAICDTSPLTRAHAEALAAYDAAKEGA